MKIEQVKTNTSGIHIAGGWKALPLDSYCPAHLHTETEFLYVTQGRVTVECAGNTFDVNKGETLMVSRSIPHATSHTKDIPTASILLQVNLEKFNCGENKMLQNILGFLNENRYPYYTFKVNNPITEEINACISEMLREKTINAVGKEFYIKSCVYRLSGILHRNRILDDYFSDIDIKGLNRLQPALLYIDRHLKDNITLESLAETVHLNPEYLSRMFKKITGKNIFSYINYIRINNACKLLVDTDMSVLEIAMESGYSSISNFNRYFLKIKDCTPSAYRKLKAEGNITL